MFVAKSERHLVERGFKEPSRPLATPTRLPRIMTTFPGVPRGEVRRFPVFLHPAFRHHSVTIIHGAPLKRTPRSRFSQLLRTTAATVLQGLVNDGARALRPQDARESASAFPGLHVFTLFT